MQNLRRPQLPITPHRLIPLQQTQSKHRIQRPRIAIPPKNSQLIIIVDNSSRRLNTEWQLHIQFIPFILF
jgi:hypothetical protein